MSSGEVVIPNSQSNGNVYDNYIDWRNPAVFYGLGRTASPEVDTTLDTDADKLDTIIGKVEASLADISDIPAREEINNQIARLQLIDARIALIDAECIEANEKLAIAGEELKVKICEKKQSVQEALVKKEAATAKFKELEVELQSVPEIVAKGLQELLEDIALQSISEVHSGLGSLGQRSLGNHDIAVKILQLRSAKAVMLNAITNWEDETQALEALISERTRLITAAELLHKKLEEEKRSRAQYVETRVVPASRLVTETTRRDRFANAISGLGTSAVGIFRRNPSQQTNMQTQLIVGVEQNGGI
jgi:hypothetical protein